MFVCCAPLLSPDRGIYIKQKRRTRRRSLLNLAHPEGFPWHKCLWGSRDDLSALYLSNLLLVRTLLSGSNIHVARGLIKNVAHGDVLY